MILLDTQVVGAATKFLMSATKKPDPSTLAARVKEAREALGLSQPELAAKVGMSQQGINEIEASRSLRPRKMVELAQALQRSQEWLLGLTNDEATPTKPEANASFPPRYTRFPEGRIPVLGQTMSGPNGRFVLNGQQVASVFCPPILDGVEGAYAVLVYGTSMEPKFEAGETAWVHPYLPVRRGDYVVAQMRSETDEIDSYLKQFVSLTSTTLTLKQFNPEEGEDEFLELPAAHVAAIHKVVFQQLL